MTECNHPTCGGPYGICEHPGGGPCPCECHEVEKRPSSREEAEERGIPNPAIRCTYCGAFGVVRLPTINDHVALCPDDDAERLRRVSHASDLRQINYPMFDFSPKNKDRRRKR